ncbi:MAG: hypothetical protein ACI89X_003392 [Planctomycetota bacterium]|jgi:hypothetical protein
MSKDTDDPLAKLADPATPPTSAAAAPAQIEVSLDVLGALLGGAAAKVSLAGLPGSPAFIATLDAPRAWLSPGIAAAEPSPGNVRQFALEITVLKLRCFDALVRMLIGAGHVGGLPSSHVKARMLDQPGAMRPARWAFEVVLEESTGNTSPTNLAVDLSNLLARMLLSNDERTPEQAEQLAAEATEQFLKATAGVGSTPDSSERLQAAALAVLSGGDIANSNSVLHGSAIRNRMAGNAIPRSLWLMATKLMLRLRTKVDGFSFGKSPLLDLCAELATLGQHLDVATFGAMARRAEIEAVVRSQLEKLT